MPSQNAGMPSPAVVNRRIRVILPTALVARRHRCQWHGNQQRQQYAAEHQEQGRLNAGTDQLQGIDFVEQRLAEIAFEQVLEKVEVLHPQGLVETVLGTNSDQRLRRAARTQQGPGGVPGD